jgi:arsenate reductase-like glutaredoxin family protein
LDEPRLIRRPLIEVDGRLVIGADLRALDEALT